MMLKLTGGSRYWTGETQAALEFMEAAVAAALEMPPPPASQSATRAAPPCGHPAPPRVEPLWRPRTAGSATLPPITASVAGSVGCGLQMAGIETKRCRE
jgi:hypothetical protein